MHGICFLDDRSVLSNLIVKVPAGKGEFLAVVQHVSPFHENGCGLIEGQQQLTVAIFICGQPQAGLLMVGSGATTPLHIFCCLHPGDGNDHLVALGVLLADIPVCEIVTGDIHRMGL